MLSCKKKYMLTSIVTSAILFPSIMLANSNTIVVDDINVVSGKKASTIGQTKIRSYYIEGAPSATNTISDLLRGKSYVQFDQISRSSATGGEIVPPRVSIRGSKYYENSFLIDGVNNNNNLNPSGFLGTGSGYTNAPTGEAQTIFLDTSLIDMISLYTENISSQYGGFVGGVLDAKLKDAKTDRWHAMIKFKYTKDDWAKFHWTDKEKKGLDTTTTAKLQPNFTKSEFSVALNGPLSDNLGLMVSYGRKGSKIPLWSNYLVKGDSDAVDTRERRNQRRKNENFLFKFNTVGYEDFKISLTGIYAPYEQEMVIPNYKNSDYSIKGGGYTAILDVENALSFGIVKNTLNFQKNQVSRISSRDVQNLWKHTPNGYADWKLGAVAGEGAFGNYKNDKISVGYKGIVDIDKFQTGSLDHSIKVGAETEYMRAKSKRGSYTSYLPGAVSDKTAVGTIKDGIIAGEQYSANKTVGIERNRKTDLFSAALFIEDKIEFDRFKFIPGLRISTDSITDNIDVAWRLYANADVFSNDLLNVYGGYNRYYGTSILSHALFIGPKTQTYSRTDWSAPWTLTKSAADKPYNNLGDLDTPYSDELSVGTSVKAFDTLFEVDFVKREYRDELRSKKVKINTDEYTIFNNSGKSDYWGLTFAISKDYDLGIAGKHFSKLSATRSSKKSNSIDPLTPFDETSLGKNLSTTYITYNGAISAIDDLPAINYNSPWIIAYTHEADIGKNVRLFAIAKYSVGGKGLEREKGTGLLAPDGLFTTKRNVMNYRDNFDIDISAEFDFKIKKNRLVFGVDILNIMNRKNKNIISSGDATADSNSYAMGRQFFANFKYQF